MEIPLQVGPLSYDCLYLKKGVHAHTGTMAPILAPVPPAGTCTPLVGVERALNKKNNLGNQSRFCAPTGIRTSVLTPVPFWGLKGHFLFCP